MKKFKALFSIAVALSLGTMVFAACNSGNDAPCAHTNLQKVDGRDATCYEEGNYAYYKCDCGAMFSDKNGTKPTTRQEVAIEKTRHDMHLYTEQVGNYSQYYFCNFCGRYYQDENGNIQIPYGEFVDSSVPPVTLENNWADPAGANAENRDFTIRCYVGWTNADGKDFSQFPSNGTVWVNVNLNRTCTLLQKPDCWYNFGVAYNAADGLQYKNFEAGHLTKVAAEFTALFVQNGGIWVRIVRQGTNCSFYFEDKYGIPIHISTNEHFDENEALYRFAYGTAEAVDGWTLSSPKAEICWGIANPRCAFSEQ